LSKLPCIVHANFLACKGGKMLCMENLGALVKEWRRRSGVTPTELAYYIRGVAVTEAGKVCKRQHIEQLEAAGDRLPRYLLDLARAMESSVDDLLRGRMPAPRGKEHEPRVPGHDFHDRHEVSESDWATLEAVKMLVPEDRINELRAQAEQARSRVLGTIQTLAPAAPPKAIDLKPDTSGTRRTGGKMLGGRSKFGELGEPELPTKKGGV
jgi:hypothetical protein